MSKSISKLIIAGMALSLAAPTGAYAQQMAKVQSAKTSGVAAKTQKAPQGKRVNLPQGLRARTLQDKAGSQLAQAGKFTRPLNFKLDRQNAPLHVTASEPVNGLVVFADNFTNEYQPYGIYSFPTNGGSNEATEVAIINSMSSAEAGVAVGDRYITSSLETFMGMFIIAADIRVYDMESWEMVQQVDCSAEFNRLAVNYAYDATTDKVYGQFYTADLSGYYFGEMDPATLEVTPIAQTSARYNVMAFDAEGTLYMIDAAGSLYTVDKTNGNETLIGATGYASQYISGGAIDQKTGRMYWNIRTDEGGWMLEVNKATAETTVMYQLANNEEVIGMYVPKPAAEPGAPAQVTDLQATFAEGSLTGTISFKAPTTLFDGTAASGSFSYEVKANNEVIATGTVDAGAEVKVDYTAPASGDYKFVAYCINEAGNGPQAKLTTYVGVDTPLDPTDVALTYADNKMTLTWEAAKGAHDGYMGEVTYTITRYETGKEAVVVKEGLTECTYTEEFVPESEALRNVYYTVTAVTTAGASAPVASNSVSMGSIMPPFAQDFLTDPSIEGYTIIDANGDGLEWNVSSDNGLQIRYSSTYDMDDWCITPAIKVEANKYYAYKIVVANNSTVYQEKIEVKGGKAATAEAMTEEIIPATEITTGGDDLTLEGGFITTEAGDYYIGIHGISSKDQFNLYVREYSIAEGTSTGVPAKPETNLETITNNFFEGVITFTVPSTNIAGEPISSLDKIEIVRTDAAGNKVVVYSKANPTPGEKISYSDIVAESGVYSYEVIAYNAEGAGLVAKVSGYIGIPLAAAPAEATIAKTANVGEVHVEWTPVTESVDGRVIPAEYITYTVIDNQSNVIAEGLTGNSIDIQAVTEGQDFVQYGVYAVTAAGASDLAVTDMIPVGTPYELPYIESFNDAGISYILGTNSAGGAKWGLADNERFTDLMDADGTNGYAIMEGNYPGDHADLFTGMITLNAEAPTLKFSYYNIVSDDNNEIEVYVTCDGQMELLKSIVMNGDGEEVGWHTAYVDLSAYAGKTVQITWRGLVVGYKYIMMDAIQIAQLADYDLQLTNVDAPAAVHANETFAVTATVLNAGAKTTADYTVELYNNGILQEVKEGVEIATGEKAAITFEQTLAITAKEENIYTVKLVSDVDMNQDDNNSGEYPVILILPNYPTATALKATLASGGVSLTWEEPDTEAAPVLEAVTEDFESYEAWSTSGVGEWTFVDEDGKAVGGVQGMDIPNIVPGETLMSFIVMNDTYSEFNQTFAAHSGHQYLSNMFAYDDTACADWLISPELSGDAQTISFYARSYSASYPETIKVLYSTTDTEITSFTEIAEYERLADAWAGYSVELPAGAKYFAIEDVASSSFMLFIDDVTYIPANAQAEELSIVGYNIYRNGVKINDAPVAETNYFDADGAKGDIYCVSVVYTVGESGPSLFVGVGIDGTVGVDDIAGKVAAVKVADRTIVVTNAEGTVAVYAADGKAIYSEAAAKTNTVAVTPGVYVVKAGEKITKVVVK